MTILSPQTRDYGIDWMHTVDSGCGKVAFYLFLHVGFEKKERWKHITKLPTGLNRTQYKASVEDAFAVFRICLPSDFARKPRSPFVAATIYKTAEMRTALTRFSPALIHIPRVRKFLDQMHDRGFVNNFMNLVTFCKLIGNFSAKPLTPVSPNLLESSS
jgi:hypothetical protein